MQFTSLYVQVSILLVCGNHLHERIVSLIGEAWALKTSFKSFKSARTKASKVRGHVYVSWWFFSHSVKKHVYYEHILDIVATLCRTRIL